MHDVMYMVKHYVIDSLVHKVLGAPCGACYLRLYLRVVYAYVRSSPGHYIRRQVLVHNTQFDLTGREPF
jgi:hypothetical protein